MDLKLEVLVLPVADIERAKSFYTRLGFREDMDANDGDYRVIQFTPPGSDASVIFGKGIKATAAPVQNILLAVLDIEEARADLITRGIEVSEIFHDTSGIFHHAEDAYLVAGPQPQRGSYGSYASFSDPDGNGWVLQEITERLPGHEGALPRR
ncbi:VOC family protein [Streptomyces sp. NBC_00178]|uniref:VOC family protein n=1 Tax=Streptomyces sp. NBC_00178 TaxID=2975672 RepID=UPI002E2BD68A|nr:VOC family protein [Streptomyces sp. NBC_00178]